MALLNKKKISNQKQHYDMHKKEKKYFSKTKNLWDYTKEKYNTRSNLFHLPNKPVSSSDN